VAKDKGKRRLTQSRSIAGFKPFTLERRTDNDLPQHIKGVAVWKEIEDEEGYWVFDLLSNTYLAIEYEEATRQWYFIRQDSRTNNWFAVDTVPSTYGLGRSVHPVTTVAVDADDTEATSGQYQSSYFKPGNIQSSAMTSAVTTAAAALTLANTSAPSRLAQNFFSRRPGGGPPGGSGGGPSGGGAPPPVPPGSGGGGGRGGGSRGGGVVFPPVVPPGAPGGKLGGNPPNEFNGDRSLADEFMNAFNLYRLTNVDTEQMLNPMKRATLLLGFIKGPNVKDWVKRWTTWIITQYDSGLATTDEHYWNEIRIAFQASFQDTASREQAEDKLRHLAFIPGDVDTFIAQFKSLALEATYELNAKPTMSLFASKLLFKMMDHVYKVARPQDFQQWTDTVRQYHQDNTAVQNIRGIYEDTLKKQSSQKKGFSAAELAKILGVKMPTPDPNAMDTRADRSRVFNKNRGTKGHAGTTTTDPIEKQHKEGRCFTCGKQGHIARVCPDKDKDKKGKAPVKSRKAQTEDSGAEGDGESSDEEGTVSPAVAYVRLGRSMKEADKLTILKMAVDAEQGKEVELDF
jgi:hypothetical protein